MGPQKRTLASESNTLSRPTRRPRRRPSPRSCERCGEYFAWSGSIVAQPFQSRLADGMIRCYFVHDQVVGFCHQRPRGLLDSVPQVQQAQVGPAPRPPMEDPDAPSYQALRASAEHDWLPGMKELLGLDTHSLPVIWDADFLFGPKDANGADTYVLCEINVSAVWPYPTQASRKIAEATIARLQAAKGLGAWVAPAARISLRLLPGALRLA